MAAGDGCRRRAGPCEHRHDHHHPADHDAVRPAAGDLQRADPLPDAFLRDDLVAHERAGDLARRLRPRCAGALDCSDRGRHPARSDRLGPELSSSYVLYVTATAADGQCVVAEYVLTTPAVTGPVHVDHERRRDPLRRAAVVPEEWSGTSAPTGSPGTSQSASTSSWATAAAAARSSRPGWAASAPRRRRTRRRGRACGRGRHAPPGRVGHAPPGRLHRRGRGASSSRAQPGSGPRFLTLTNHFYSRAAPLPQGRGHVSRADSSAARTSLGFDLYPLQNWCRWDSFHDVFDSQLDLVALARGKPTFQWIEARQDGLLRRRARSDPRDASARRRGSSIAGGAHAIGYFPNNWVAAVGAEIARTNHEIQTLVPALVEPCDRRKPSLGSFVKVGARTTTAPSTSSPSTQAGLRRRATITVPALGDRMLRTLDGQHNVRRAAARSPTRSLRSRRASTSRRRNSRS